jgi:hypothetical protein
VVAFAAVRGRSDERIAGVLGSVSFREEQLAGRRGQCGYRVRDEAARDRYGPRGRYQRAVKLLSSSEDARHFVRLEDEDLAAVARAACHSVCELAIDEHGEPLLREQRTGA